VRVPINLASSHCYFNRAIRAEYDATTTPLTQLQPPWQLITKPSIVAAIIATSHLSTKLSSSWPVRFVLKAIGLIVGRTVKFRGKVC